VRNVLGCASFLIVLRTQRISRSLSLIPQRIPASLAVVSAAAGPASHSHPARVCSVLHPPSHAGQGILWESLAVGRGVASARSTDAGRRRRPARWTRLYASNRLRSRRGLVRAPWDCGGALGAGAAGAGGCAWSQWPAAGPLIAPSARLRGARPRRGRSPSCLCGCRSWADLARLGGAPRAGAAGAGGCA
jgi:hypothetical protein